MLHYRNLKILILFSYYQRPLLVREALKSIIRADQYYKNWHLAFGDDGSPDPGDVIVKEVMKDYSDKISFYNTNDTVASKVENGIRIGRLANKVLSETDCDIVITLCDDDQLHPLYLKNLNHYFLKNKDVMYCYSNIYIFNPNLESPEELTSFSGPYNSYKEPISCYGKVDASQVAFRIECIRNYNIWYRETTKSSKDNENPLKYSLDGELFKDFYSKIGPAYYTGFASQYKGMHENQLVYNKEHIFKNKDDVLSFYENFGKPGICSK